MAKTIIIGGGPAGLSAAYFGRINDFDVTLIETNSSDNNPSKPCGEAIPSFIFDYLPKDLEKDFILNHIKRAHFYFNDEFVREFKNMPLINGFIIDKKLFLFRLAELAESIGARLIWNKFVNPAKVNELMQKYDIVIDATGRGSLARKFIDYSNYKTIPVLQAYATGDGVPDDTIVLWGLDKGYAWVFPRGDIFNIGIGGVYRDPIYLKKIIVKILKYFKLRFISDLKGSAVSIGGPIERFSYNNLRVIGEAAGLVMPTTGEGIRFAVASGMMVFDSDYEKKIWNEFGWKIKNGKKLLNTLLKIKNKAKLARIASDEEYFAFFEGLYSYSKIIKLGLKYVLKR